MTQIAQTALLLQAGALDPGHTFLLAPEAVLQMVERHPFDTSQIRAALVFVLAMNGDFEKNPGDSPHDSISVQFSAVSDGSITISPKALDNLAKQLRSVAGAGVPANPELLADVLSKVAFIASHAGLRVAPPSAEPGRLDHMIQCIRTDFAIACARALARSSGHAIVLSEVQQQEIFWALQDKDREWLARVFLESLPAARPVNGRGHGQGRRGRHAFTATTSQGVEQILLDSRERLLSLGDAVFDQAPFTRQHAIELMDHPVRINQTSLAEISLLRRLLGPSFDIIIDMVLGRAKPDFRPPANLAARELSGKSYANLRSVADMEDWNDDEVLRLIDEHLNPALSPHFVYHGSTVSGDDWRRLRRRLRRFGR